MWTGVERRPIGSSVPGVDHRRGLPDPAEAHRGMLPEEQLRYLCCDLRQPWSSLTFHLLPSQKGGSERGLLRLPIQELPSGYPSRGDYTASTASWNGVRHGEASVLCFTPDGKHPVDEPDLTRESPSSALRATGIVPDLFMVICEGATVNLSLLVRRKIPWSLGR